MSVDIKKGEPMEHLPDNQPGQSNNDGNRNLYWGLALVVVLIVGLSAGYLIGQAQSRPVQVAVTATSEPTEQVAAQAEPQTPTRPATATSPVAEPDTPPTPTIMEFVLSDARHFQGSDEAPITMIEFSDFK